MPPLRSSRPGPRTQGREGSGAEDQGPSDGGGGQVTTPSFAARAFSHAEEFLAESQDFADLSAAERHKLLLRARMLLRECMDALAATKVELPLEPVVMIPLTKHEFRA